MKPISWLKQASTATLVFVGVIVTIFVLTVGAVFYNSFISSTTAETRGETKVRERTKADGAFRQSAYEEFFDLCAAVQSAEAQRKALKTELETKPSADRVEKINTSLAAVEATRAESINKYNSKAKQYHREAFLDSDLPPILDVDAQETLCAV